MWLDRCNLSHLKKPSSSQDLRGSQDSSLCRLISRCSRAVREPMASAWMELMPPGQLRSTSFLRWRKQLMAARAAHYA